MLDVHVDKSHSVIGSTQAAETFVARNSDEIYIFGKRTSEEIPKNRCCHIDTFPLLAARSLKERPESMRAIKAR